MELNEMSIWCEHSVTNVSKDDTGLMYSGLTRAPSLELISSNNWSKTKTTEQTYSKENIMYIPINDISKHEI